MNLIEKDILTVKEGIICQQVNCKGKMGTGIAYKFRKKWPELFESYIEDHKSGHLKLGVTRFFKVNNNLFIANIAAQNAYGRDKRYTDYMALGSCLSQVNDFSIENNLQIYIPFKMGCVNAGGNWDVVKKIIDNETSKTVVCRIRRK